MLNPVENATNGVGTVASLVDSSRLESEIAENRLRLLAGYEIDPETLERLEGHSVHIDPSEAAAAWAYDLDWHPLPVFQPYVAWTPELDQRNADAVASPDGPERILRQNLNALGRFPAYDSPAAMIAMLCNFEAETNDLAVAGSEARPESVRRAAAAGQRGGSLRHPDPGARGAARQRRLRPRARRRRLRPRARAHRPAAIEGATGLLRGRSTALIHPDRRHRRGRAFAPGASADRLPGPVRARAERRHGHLLLEGGARTNRSRPSSSRCR